MIEFAISESARGRAYFLSLLLSMGVDARLGVAAARVELRVVRVGVVARVGVVVRVGVGVVVRVGVVGVAARVGVVVRAGVAAVAFVA